LFEGQESDEGGWIIGRPVERHTDYPLVSRGPSRELEQVLETIDVPAARWAHFESPDSAEREWEVVEAVDELETLGHANDGNGVKSGDGSRGQRRLPFGVPGTMFNPD
jgi:hypothetical protein